MLRLKSSEEPDEVPYDGEMSILSPDITRQMCIQRRYKWTRKLQKRGTSDWTLLTWTWPLKPPKTMVIKVETLPCDSTSPGNSTLKGNVATMRKIN